MKLRLVATKEAVLLALSLLAALAAVASLFMPDSNKTARIDWDPRIDANPAAFDSYAPQQQLTVIGQRAPDLIAEPTVVTTGYFDTSLNNETVSALRVEISNEGVRGELISPLGEVREVVGPAQVGGATGGFPEQWSVTVDQDALILKTSNTTLSTPLPPDRVVTANWLEATGEPLADVRVVVALTGGALDTAGPLHALFIWIAVALLVIVLLLLTQPWTVHWAQVLKHLRLSRLDAFVASGLFLSAFVSRTTYDDGWMMQWAQDATSGPWGPTTPFMHTPESSVHLFQGFLYNSLLGVVSARQESVIGIRFLTIVSIFACWLLLSRIVLRRILGKDVQPALWATASFTIIYGLGWMTLRAEIPLFLASVIFLSISVVRPYSRPALAIVGLSTSAAFAVATHPLGLMMILPLAIVLIPVLREPSVSPSAKWTGLLAGGAGSIILVFFNQSLGLFLRGVEEYEDIPLDPFDEWGRFADLFRIGTITQRAWFLVGLVALVSLWLFALRILLRSSRREFWHYTLFAAAVMPVGLVFTASKWLWHYAALMAPMAIGVAFAAYWLANVPRQSTLRLLLVVGTTTWIGLAVKDSEFDRQWTAPVVFSTLTLSTLAIYWPRSKREDPVGRSFIVACIVLGTVTTLHAVDLARNSGSGWSFLSQSVNGIWDAKLRCGIPSFVHINGAKDMNAVDVVREAGVSVAVPFEFGLQSPCFDVPRRANGLWDPAYGALVTQVPVDRSLWLHSEELAAGCVEVNGPGTYTYPFCFRQTLPTGVPTVTSSLVDSLED